MKKLIALILFPFLFIPFGAKANDNFSVEIEALTLVMEQYKEDTESSVELDIEDKKPSYMALKQDECNATVEVTEKTGLEGDLFHSKYSIDKTLQNKVEDLPEILKINVELVLGNHDVGCDIKNIKIFDIKKTKNIAFSPVSYTHLTLPTTLVV